MEINLSPPKFNQKSGSKQQELGFLIKNFFFSEFESLITPELENTEPKNLDL